MPPESSPQPEERPAGREEETATPECDGCGAALQWSPAHGALHCSYCDGTQSVPAERTAVLENPVGAGRERAPRGYGVALRVLRCQGCGASVAVDPKLEATRCSFCDSPQVATEVSEADVIRPSSLVPMRVSREQAREGFRRWVRGLWFRPNALKRAPLDALKGIYVPWWTFDAVVDSDWTAMSGTYYWVTETYTTMVNGKPQVRTRQVRKVRWWPSSGSRRDAYDDVLVCASRSLPGHLAVRLDTFDTGRLLNYHPHYLAGFSAERYGVSVEEGNGTAHERMSASQRERCAGDVPGDTHRALRVRDTYSSETFKHVLLPVWLLSYTFGGKPYRVLVNGQTGEVEGDAPLSAWKILLLVLIILAAAATVWLLAANG